MKGFLCKSHQKIKLNIYKSVFFLMRLLFHFFFLVLLFDAFLPFYVVHMHVTIFEIFEVENLAESQIETLQITNWIWFIVLITTRQKLQIKITVVVLIRKINHKQVTNHQSCQIYNILLQSVGSPKILQNTCKRKHFFNLYYNYYIINFVCFYSKSLPFGDNLIFIITR